MIEDRWTPTSDRTWLVSYAEPAVMVKVSSFGTYDHDKALADDPAALAKVLIEMMAFEIDDESLGAFVREVLTPARVAGIGSWKWSQRVIHTKPEEKTSIGGSL